MTTEERKKYIQRFEKIYSNCLFRYRSVSDDNLSAIENNRLYFSSPNSFNDPYDNLIYADIDKILFNIASNIKFGMNGYLMNLKNSDPQNAFIGEHMWNDQGKRDEILKNHFDHIDNIVINIKKWIRCNSRVICFSEEYSSMLMWSHYANYHQGFSLIYDKNDLMYADRFTMNDQPLNEQICLKKVDYVSQQFDLTDDIENYVRYNVLETMGDVELLDGRVPKYKLRQAIIEKSEEWSYEKEWRIIPRIIDLITPSSLGYINCKPKGIILGAHCELKDSENLIDIGKKNHIPVYRMFLDKFSPEYKLIIGQAEDATIA